MRNVVLACAGLAVGLTAFSTGVSAQSIDAVLQRLDALEKENSVLRDRVKRLESSKQNAASARAPATQSNEVSSAMAAAPATTPAYKGPVPAVAAWNWTGFYVGAHLGAGWARKKWTDQPEDPCFFFDSLCRPVDLGSDNAKGLLGGLQAGYNWQVGRVVFGVEGQYSFTDLKGDHQNSFSAGFGTQVFDIGQILFIQNDFHDQFSTQVKNLATIAGRIGLASGPEDRTLFYLKGGAAWARDNFAVRSTQSFVRCDAIGHPLSCFDNNSDASLSARQSRWGWMVGTGLEYGLFDNWSAK